MSDTLAGLNAQIERLELERMVRANVGGPDRALARLDAALLRCEIRRRQIQRDRDHR